MNIFPSIIYFSTFALISPVGAGIGILISETVKVKKLFYVDCEPLWGPAGFLFLFFHQMCFQSEAETQTVAVTVLQVKMDFSSFKRKNPIIVKSWQGLATGTLLYVVFFEVIEKERLKGTTGMVQVKKSP